MTNKIDEIQLISNKNVSETTKMMKHNIDFQNAVEHRIKWLL